MSEPVWRQFGPMCEEQHVDDGPEFLGAHMHDSLCGDWMCVAAGLSNRPDLPRCRRCEAKLKREAK